eukprot:553073_1
MSKSTNPETQNYDMRHVMLITDTEVSWKYLYDMNILQHNASRVIFGSKFKNDNSSLHLHQNIDKIKNAMLMGHTVVLLHLDDLYDSLYDVLNQRYLTIGSKRFSNISIRNETIRVQIDPSFRFIIVIPTTHAHHTAKDSNAYTPVAFLNRLEKHYLSLKNLCGTRKNWDQLLQRLEIEIEEIFGSVHYSQVFAGFVPRLTFASVLIYVENKFYGLYQPTSHGNESIEDDSDEDEKGDDDEDIECKMKDPDTEIINYSIALLLSNCYLRHFISHKSDTIHKNDDLFLHKKLKPIQREECFSSIQDVMEYFTSLVMTQEDDQITLIRVTTHDHFQHVSDFKKHFQIKRTSDEFELMNQDMLNIASLRAPDSIAFITTMDDEEEDEDRDSEHKADVSNKDNAMLINIGDIGSSSEFVGAINEFLVDKEYHTLIIQTTNKNNDEFLHNLHIQYLIEQAKHIAQSEASLSREHLREKVANKQIIVIVYMNRLTTAIKSKNDAEAAQYIQSQQYPLIFNCEWRQIYCDAILPSEIKITDLNINDTYSSNLFELRIAKHTESVIESTFEMALNNIRFPAKMREEVDRITKIFYDPHDKSLKRAIIARIKEVLSSSHGGSPLDAIQSLLKQLKDKNRRLSIGSDTSMKSRRQKPIRSPKLSDDIISERGSFRQLLIKQISKQMKSELVEVLVAILNHHSSDLYRPQPKLHMTTSLQSVLLNDLDEQREARKNDVWMTNMWLVLLRHKSGIVRVQSRLGRNNNCSNVEIKLKVEFPFSPYIDAYFHHIQREIESNVRKEEVFKQNTEMQVNESGHKGQQIMVPIIQKHLQAAGYDCLLGINKYIEWYVYDVAVLELQKQFGLRYSEYYFDALTRFIQQFILCAAHETHEKFESTSYGHLVMEEKGIDDETTDANDGSDDHGAVLHEEEDDESDDDDSAGGMKMESDGSHASESDSDDPDEDKSEKDSDEDSDTHNHPTDEGVSSSEEAPQMVESDDEKKEDVAEVVADVIPFPYGIHEIHAALWCNEQLLQNLIHMMSLLKHKPQKLDSLATVCWGDFSDKGLLKCVYLIMNRVIDLIHNWFQNADSFTFKILMNMILDCSESVTWVLHWLQKQHFNLEKLFSLNTKWDLIRLYLLCYKPFEKCQNITQLKVIKERLQSLYDAFKIESSDDAIVFGTVDRVMCIYELMNSICESLMVGGEQRMDKMLIDSTQTIQYVIQQYICNFALSSFEVMPNEEFMFYLISLMSDKEASATDEEDDEEKFLADSYTKQEIASKILKLISIKDEAEMRRILNKLNDALAVSRLLSAVLLRAAECEEHAKWRKRSKKKQTPSEKNINEAAKQLKKTQTQSYLHQLLAIAKCKVIVHYAVANMKKLPLKALSKMFVAKSKSLVTAQYESLIYGLGFFFFSEFWREKGSLDACHLRKNRKFTEQMMLSHIFEPDDMDVEGGDVIIMKSRYKHLDDNIFNLLIDDESNKLQTMKASRQTIWKINSTLKKWKTLNVVQKDDFECIEYDEVKEEDKKAKKKMKFTLLSEEMYGAVTRGEKMSDELQLEESEIVHLVGAVFNCSYLYGGNHEERIYLWLRNQMVIPTPSRQHFLIGQLLNNSSRDVTLKYEMERPPPLEQMLRIRLAWHLFGAASSVDKCNPFYVLLDDPLFYEDGFVIGMPESQQMALLRAMQGHSVFICPNKHLYFVANCGATKESARCYQCNAAVGNVKHAAAHIAAKGNKKLGVIGTNGEIIADEYGANNGVAQIPSEYMATGYLDCSHDDCVRNLSEVAVCIIRCFVLCMLWLHHSERSDEFPSQCLRFMYPHTHQQSQQLNDDKLSISIHDQIKKYIRKIQKKLARSIEDTLYVLHAIIHKFYINYDACVVARKRAKDLTSRVQFEAFFMSHCVEPVMQNLDGVIHNVRSVVSSHTFKKYWSKRIDNELTNEAQLQAAFVDKYSPHLFLPFRHITLSHFRSYVLANADPSLYPITCGLIDALDHVGLSIFATQYIPAIVTWMKLVHERLSGRISKKEMNEIDPQTNLYKLNAEWLLNKCRDEGFGDEKKWNQALIGFVNGWNDVARRVTTKESEKGAKIPFNSEENTFEEYARRIVIRHECKTVPISEIVARDSKAGIRAAEVALKLCVNAVGGQMDSTLMIQGILDHLVAANRAILQFCKQYQDGDEDLYATRRDFIDLTHISRSSDVVDCSQSELLSILQDCTQQSLEYGCGNPQFAMNLALLESKLYERYIIGRKLINYAKQEFAFVFAGYHDIKSYVDRINSKFGFDQNQKKPTLKTYFVECSTALLDCVSLKLRIKSDRQELQNNLAHELRIIDLAKRGIEQTLIALLRWPTLPNQHVSIGKFMKENLKLYSEEYELFDEMRDELLLKHCDGLWRLLDRLYTFKEGKWSQIPHNIANIFRKQIADDALIVDLKQFVNGQDEAQMLQLLIDWKEFMENILSEDILNAHQTKLITYLNYTVTNPDILKNGFPDQIKLIHCVVAYEIAATQFKTKTIQK